MTETSNTTATTPEAIKAGFKTSEFAMFLVRFLIGAGLTVYEPTREIGTVLLGLGGRDGAEYLRARMILKTNGQIE